MLLQVAQSDTILTTNEVSNKAHANTINSYSHQVIMAAALCCRLRRPSDQSAYSMHSQPATLRHGTSHAPSYSSDRD